MSFKTSASNSNSTTGNVVSLSIRSEIQRFESVHPSIYSIYELIEHLADTTLTNLIREHVVNIEDSFVNSQEWTLSRSVEEIRIGILGSRVSQKSTLVHRYLTGECIEDNSPEGGRFKKELILNNKAYMLLLRDEGGHPELQFTHWLDVLILVSNSAETVRTCYSYVSRLSSYKCLNEIPMVLVSIGDDSLFINDFKKIPHNIYINVDVVTGRNVEAAFDSAVSLIKPFTPSTPRKLFPQSMITRRRSNLFKTVDEELGVGRVIPLKQGYLLKKSKNDKLKKWKKKYVILTKDYKFNYYENINNYMENGNPKIIDLKHSNVKKNSKNYFVINTLEKNYEFECSNFNERDAWVELIEKQILQSLQGTNNLEEINDILSLNGNNYCADCNIEIDDSFWISINFAVIICIDCSGIHRNLGSHISRVRSLHLDEISPWILSILKLMEGNVEANKIYECGLKDKKMNWTSSIEEKLFFIRRKYEKLEFLPLTTKDIFKTLKEKDFRSFIPALFKQRNVELIFEDLITFICFDMQHTAFLQTLLWAYWDDLESKFKQNIKTKILKGISIIKDPYIKSIIQSL